MSLYASAEYRYQTRKQMVQHCIPGGQTCYEEIKASDLTMTGTHDPRVDKETLFLSRPQLKDSVDCS